MGRTCHHRSLVHQSRVMDSWHKKSEQSEHMSLTQSQLGGNHAEGSLNHSTQTTQITKRFTSRSRSQEGDLRAPAGRCACVKALIYIYINKWTRYYHRVSQTGSNGNRLCFQRMLRSKPTNDTSVQYAVPKIGYVNYI